MSNREDLSSVFLKLRRSLAKVASSIAPPKEIEDIVQETYVRICEVSEQDTIQNPRSFMYKIVKNLALDHVKRAEHRLSLSLNDESHEEIQSLLEADTDDTTFQQVSSRQEFELFCQAIRQLPLQCRRVFILKKVYGYSQKEIALDLKISESTVEKHLAFGLKRCSHYLNFNTKNDSPSNLSDTSAAELSHD